MKMYNTVQTPHIASINGVPNLIVDGLPFICLAGELRNSSASNETYMNENVWSKLEGLNLNTLLVPVYWELIESEEGKFDFESIKFIIDQARNHNIKLIVLWFGLWKNGLSTYVPSWVKLNREEYYFAKDRNGNQIYSISPLCDKAISKDAYAFKKLMSFIRDYDENYYTVIMIQIQNEMGLLTTDFDYQVDQLEKLDTNVPRSVAEYAKSTGTWNSVFNQDAKEYYISYHFAMAIKLIAEFGKQEYDIPYFVNAWIDKQPTFPGEYPTGGPISKFAPFWIHLVNDITAIAPDIYVPNFKQVCINYAEAQDLLIIPETRQDYHYVASNLIYGISAFNLYCYSPFGIEDFMDAAERDDSTLTALSIDADAFNSFRSFDLLSCTYRLLASMNSVITTARNDGLIQGFIKEEDSSRGFFVELEDAFLRIKYAKNDINTTRSSGFVIKRKSNEVFIVGTNINVSLESNSCDVGVITLEEGYFEDSLWIRQRILNGDERYYIKFNDFPSVVRLVYHTY